MHPDNSTTDAPLSHRLSAIFDNDRSRGPSNEPLRHGGPSGLDVAAASLTTTNFPGGTAIMVNTCAYHEDRPPMPDPFTQSMKVNMTVQNDGNCGQTTIRTGWRRCFLISGAAAVVVLLVGATVIVLFLVHKI